MANRRYIDFPIASTSGDTDIILIWQGGANKQTTKATFLSGLPENLDELNDVAISGLTNGQILRYDSVTGKWENTDQGNLDLNDLNDVSIVSPSNGQVLVYNSSTSKWENSSGGYVPYTGAVTTVNLGAQTIQAGQFVKAGGTSAQFLKADGSVDSNTYGTGTVTSVALTMPSAFSVANSPITTAGTLAVTGAGTVGQYIRGDGSLADFPESSGGGSSVSYYLNGSVNQGTIGGVAYKELNKVPILGAGTDFTINANGYIASFITDAGDPNLLEIPGGNWNFETYFSASSSGGTPTFYVELYKVNSGGTATLIASNSGFPELIAFGTNIISYFSTLAVPTTTLALTDRLAIRYYVTHSGRTITLHTEDNHLCQIITTFTTGITALNGLTAQVQNFAVGTSGTDFNIASATATHTFNLPTASATNRGALSSADWTTFNNKQNALGYVPVPETRTITINGVSQDLSANRTYNVGTVTSVGLSSATSGVTIGSTPVTTSGTITLAIATASGSQNGLLSSTDWTTFNNKQNALTNPVTGTGVSGRVAFWNGTNSITSDSDLLFDGSSVTVGGNIVLTNGANRFVRIGSASNYNYDLQTTGDDFQIIEAGASIATPRLTIKYPNGNVLINTTTDNGARLQVSGTATVSGNGLFGGATALAGLAGGIAVNGSTNSGINFRIADVLRGYVYVAGNLGMYVESTAGNVVLAPTGNAALTATTSGNVGIGTTSPDANSRLDVNGQTFVAHLAIYNNNGTPSLGTSPMLYSPASATLSISTGTVERMRINSGGFLKASNTGTYASSTGLYHEFITNRGDNLAYFWNTSANPYGPYVRFSGAAPNNGTNYYFYCDDTSAARFIVYSNGGISNYQANNTNLSDERTKKEIAPLESYWDKFKAIEIVKFKYKDQTHNDFNIGVIAQQVEKVAPEFVDVDGWNNKTEGNEVVSQEEPIKSIYTADLHHATIKVLQEAMAKIEAMQKEIDTLKN